MSDDIDFLGEIHALKQENERLRAALAQSDQPCAYCSLLRGYWVKCDSGFPGCGRVDDAMGCPELGARLEVDRLKEILNKIRLALAEWSSGL